MKHKKLLLKPQNFMKSFEVVIVCFIWIEEEIARQVMLDDKGPLSIYGGYGTGNLPNGGAKKSLSRMENMSKILVSRIDHKLKKSLSRI